MTTRQGRTSPRIESALTIFRLDNSKYPTTEQGLAALTTQPTDPSIRNWRPGGYLTKKVGKDPWGNDYQYVYPGTHGERVRPLLAGGGQPARRRRHVRRHRKLG